MAGLGDITSASTTVALELGLAVLSNVVRLDRGHSSVRDVSASAAAGRMESTFGMRYVLPLVFIMRLRDAPVPSDNIPRTSTASREHLLTGSWRGSGITGPRATTCGDVSEPATTAAERGPLVRLDVIADDFSLLVCGGGVVGGGARVAGWGA
jgi:hypothetical protein